MKSGSSKRTTRGRGPPKAILEVRQPMATTPSQRVVRKYNPPLDASRERCRDPARRVSILGLSLEGSGPCANGSPSAKAGETGARRTHRAPGARRGQSWHRRSSAIPQRELTQATASNLDTSLDRGRSRSVHAVEFSKTVAPLQEGNPPPGRARTRVAPGRTDEYSAPEGRRR